MTEHRGKLPPWIRGEQPEPARGSLRALIQRMAVRRCCPFHSAMDTALKAAWQPPPAPCVLCGAPGTWRQGWPPDAEVQTVCRATVEGAQEIRYLDLCQRCHLDPASPGRIAELMRQRQAKWN